MNDEQKEQGGETPGGDAAQGAAKAAEGTAEAAQAGEQPEQPDRIEEGDVQEGDRLDDGGGGQESVQG